MRHFRLFRLFRANVPADVDAELHFHFESRIDDLVSQGMTSDAARAQATREFGNVAEVKRDLVSIDHRVAARRRRGETARDVIGDAAYAVRSLRRSPGVALAILATLALGVGGNASMFTLLETLFLRPPAGVVNPDTIRRLWVERQFVGGRQFWPGFSYAKVIAVKDVIGDRADIGVYYQPTKAKIGLGEGASEAQVSFAGISYFGITGVHAEFGRLYDAREDALDAPAPVAVISHRYWEREFNSDRAAIGQTIVIDGVKHTIIGVMAAPFTGVDLDAVDIWTPLAHMVEARGGLAGPWRNDPNVNGFALLVRPRPGIIHSELEQRITTVMRRPGIEGLTPDSTAIARFGSIVAANGPGTKSQEVQIAIRLAGVATVVLLIACANVVNLLLARAVRRRREIAVRLALGISRGRLIRLLLTESAVLATCAALVALAVAYLGGSLLRKLLLPDIHWAQSPVDWSVSLFALGVALGAGLVAGLIPALQSAKPELTHALKAGSGAGVVHRSRLRSGLVVAQAALSVLLLAGALLFVRSLSNVRDLDLGFDAPRLVTASVKYDDRSPSSVPQFAERLASLADRASRIPGVEHVGLTSARPMYSISWLTFFTDTDSSRRDFSPTVTGVSTGYFSAAGLRILRGTDFPMARAAASEPGVVVNQTMAKIAWPGRSALGECMRFGSRTEPCYRVIGVVEDSRENRIIEEAKPKYYVPLDNIPTSGTKFIRPAYVAMSIDPARMAGVIPTLRVLIRQEFPGSVPAITRLSDYLDKQYRPWRLGATLFTAFGVLALVVAVVGIYSTVSYGVNQRMHEFGVRVALGAKLGDVLRLVVGEGVRTVAIGIACGVGLALLAGKLIASLLYGVSPRDPAALAIVVVALLVVGALAALVPAWRASRVDPVSALRAD